MPSIDAFVYYMQLQERKQMRDEKFKQEQNEKRIKYDYDRDEILMKEEERRDNINAWRERRSRIESPYDKKEREEKEQKIYDNL
jgi:hypothetical protein